MRSASFVAFASARSLADFGSARDRVGPCRRHRLAQHAADLDRRSQEGGKHAWLRTVEQFAGELRLPGKIETATPVTHLTVQRDVERVGELVSAVADAFRASCRATAHPRAKPFCSLSS